MVCSLIGLLHLVQKLAHLPGNPKATCKEFGGSHSAFVLKPFFDLGFIVDHGFQPLGVNAFQNQIPDFALLCDM